MVDVPPPRPSPVGRTAVDRTAPLTPPINVVAERFELDGVEFVAFSWDPASTLPALTPAERAVFELLVRGASNSEIARARKASVRTVANQVANLFRKLRVGSRYVLMARYAGTPP